MPDDLDRDKMYSSDPDDDGEDYELEPPDPAILDGEQRRANEAIEALKRTIDIDEIYRDAENRQDEQILRDLAGNLKLRFRVKHMLIATTVVAVVLAIGKASGYLLSIATILILIIMAAVIGVTLFLQWQEKQRQDEADRRRQRMYAERRAALQQSSLGPTTPGDADDSD